MRTLSRPATSSQRRRQWVETEDELNGIKQTVPPREDSFAPPFLPFAPSPPPSLNFPPALFTTHRRVTFSKLLRLLYSHACLFSCYAVLLSRLCENPLRIHVHFLALSSLSLSHLLFRPCEILRFQAPCQSHALDIGHSSRSSETRFFMHFIVH